jgi:histidine triad (HIT) family protein
MKDCIFCKIVKGEIPAKRIYEDESVFAFEDINPQAPWHAVIIPKKHFATLAEASPSDEAVLGHIQTVAAKIASERPECVGGYRIVTNCGKDGGQTVSHVHYHLLGGRVFKWPPG